MTIWSAEIKDLEVLYTSLKGKLSELEKELERLIKADDENMVLLYSRRCLEVIITDLCECELKRPRKTEPLKGIIDKLHHEEKVPAHIIISMHGLNDLSTFGAHPKVFDPDQVKPVLNNLTTIIKWYLKYKDTKITEKAKPIEEKTLPEPPFEGVVRKEIKFEYKRPFKLTNRQLLSGITIIAILIISAVFVYPKIFKRDKLENLISPDGRIPVAVMPFRNMTNDTILNVCQNGIKDNLITYLSNYSEDLAVRQIEGTSEEEIFQIIDSLSVLVKDFLIISVMEKEIITDFRWLISTGSAEAYRYYNYGNKAFHKLDWPTARDWYLKATEKDTNFTETLRMLTYTYRHLGMGEEAKKTSIRLYRKKDQMSSIQEKIWADVVYSMYFETPYERIKYLGLLIDLDDQMPVPY
jgi:hypothetical protein